MAAVVGCIIAGNWSSKGYFLNMIALGLFNDQGIEYKASAFAHVLYRRWTKPAQ